jgi:mannose-6-phosphate isomerase-like protein (cupin superfamily)
MCAFMTRRLPATPDAVAPDGSSVRVLLSFPRGSMAEFELAPGETSTAVVHRTVDEIWLFLAGRGELWRRLGDDEEVVQAEPGVSITIPVGTRFQFRSFGPAPLRAVAVTLPAWPGEGEAIAVEGKWGPTVPR